MAKKRGSDQGGVGAGGETHQTVAKGANVAEARLTTNQGIPVSDNQNQLKAGERGPVLLEDLMTSRWARRLARCVAQR